MHFPRVYAMHLADKVAVLTDTGPEADLASARTHARRFTGQTFRHLSHLGDTFRT